MTEEKTPDRIVLPRSGLVLPRVTLRESGRADYGDEDAVWMSVYVDGWSYATFVGVGVDEELPRDDMIRLLDARVLALRSALLKGAEEKIVAALSGEPGRLVTEYDAEKVIAALCGEEWT